MLLATLGAVFSGVLTWTLLEYVIHRWAAHAPVRSFWRSTPFGEEHTRHHAEGNYFAPTWKKAPVALGILILVAPISIVLTNPLVGLSYASSLMLTYVAYEVLHRRLHTHAGHSAYGHWARRHHFHHHFVDPRTNHGVTSPLWDIVFGTYRKVTTIRVPERLCMAWLVDSETGAIFPGYSDTFVIGKTSP